MVHDRIDQELEVAYGFRLVPKSMTETHSCRKNVLRSQPEKLEKCRTMISSFYMQI